MNTSQPKQLVLVVDDDSIMRLLARQTLEQGGFAVEEASDGNAGLSAFERLRPNIVLLDVMMPVLDGYGACAALRKLEGGEHIPVLIMTGLDDSDSINRAYDVGATDFITKPIAWPMLVHRVRYLLRASRAFLDLARSEAQLASAQRIAQLGHWEWNVTTGQVERSPEIYRIVGRTPEQLPAACRSFLEITHPDDRALVKDALHAALHGKQPFNVSFRIVRPDGAIRIVHEQGEVHYDGAGRPVRMQGTTQDITDRKHAEEQIRQLALYDRLTGLPNRHMLQEQLSHAVAGAARSGEVFAVLSVDLDRFKRINDTLGHEIGDRLLKETANRLTKALRQADYVTRNDENEVNYFLARQGGNEFTILLSGLNEAQAAGKVARRILDALSQPFAAAGKELVLSAGIGIAVHPIDGEDADSLMKNAGTAMHYAKQQGKNGYQYYNNRMNARALEKLALEGDLRKALEKQEFVLHYQPVVDLPNRQIVGVEALVRWMSPERGLVPPIQFIPLLEESGMILEVGAWVLQQALCDREKWLKGGPFAPRIAVNVSAIQLRQKNFIEILRKALDGRTMPAGLEIEITESLIMEDVEGNVEKLRAMREMGINVAIDDFGTGYSSLGYLARLPVSTLKIDRSFVITMTSRSDSLTIVSTIISLAHSLGLRVVAEGVDTEEQAKLLRLLKCDEIQGYLIGKPQPAGEVEGFFKNASKIAVTA